MNSTLKKAGRKAAHHIDTTTGDPVIGLSRRPSDGRWRVIATGETFTEADERLAIARFHRLTGKASIVKQGFFAMHAGLPEWPEYNAETSAKIVEVLPEEQHAEINVPMSIVYSIVRRELLTNPIAFAKACGIEQLGYLTDLKPPERVPSLEDIETLWKTHSNASKGQTKKVCFAWADFVKTTKIKSIKDITTEIVIAYRDNVYARGIAPKTQHHFFGGIRRMISFPIKHRGLAVQAMSNALVCLGLLTPSETTVSLDPKPIEVADFKALLANATGDNLAMILLCLNGAFYVQECIRLNWSDIKDGCIVTHRAKAGKCIRVCVLWQETIDALAKLERKDGVDCIFRSYTGARLGIKGADKRFRELRHKATVDHVTSSQLRDGAFTAAVSANVNQQLCNVLIGHRNGIGDAYLKRAPKQVAPACEAIYAHYFPPVKETKAA